MGTGLPGICQGYVWLCLLFYEHQGPRETNPCLYVSPTELNITHICIVPNVICKAIFSCGCHTLLKDRLILLGSFITSLERLWGAKEGRQALERGTSKGALLGALNSDVAYPRSM